MDDNKIDEKTAEKIVEGDELPYKSSSTLWAETLRKNLSYFGGNFFRANSEYVQPLLMVLFMLVSLILGMGMVKRQQDLKSRAVFVEELPVRETPAVPTQVHIQESITTCDGYCQAVGYESGTCKENYMVCEDTGMVHESQGGVYCTDSTVGTSCCCE